MNTTERERDAERSGRARGESLVLISRTVLYDVTPSARSSSAGRERREAPSSLSDARYEPDYGVPVDASALSSSAARASADLDMDDSGIIRRRRLQVRHAPF